MVEKNVFTDSAVAEILSNYVEARLHTNRDPALVELQREFTARTGERSIAQPIYMIYDPESGEILGRHDGAFDAAGAIEFLSREG